MVSHGLLNDTSFMDLMDPQEMVGKERHYFLTQDC
jgi:hypothetical protein